MPLKISIHDDLSIADLINIHKEGGIVLKTPHVGNIYPNNLAITSLGIPILFYDRTIGKKDINFHPDKLIVDGKSQIIADPEILTTHSIINRDLAQYDIKVGSKLIDFHMNTLKKAIPQANCLTYSEYLQKNKGKILQILEMVTNLHPSLWIRVVDDKGKTRKRAAKNWEEVVRFGIFGVTDLRGGWLIPNPINVLFHVTIDVSNTKIDDVYLLSGPDMYKYIEDYRSELTEIYDEVRVALPDWDLPEVLTCHIIPVMGMRFIIENSDRKILDELVSDYLEFISLKNSVNNHMRQSLAKKDVQSLLVAKNMTKQKIIDCLSQNFESLGMTMFYDIKNANCFTQYDLLKSGGLYISPWAINEKLRNVTEAFIFLKRCYSQLRRQYL